MVTLLLIYGRATKFVEFNAERKEYHRCGGVPGKVTEDMILGQLGGV